MGRVFSGRPRFNLRSSHTKGWTIGLDTSLLINQYFNVRIKGKVEQLSGRSSVLPYTLVLWLLKRGRLDLPRLLSLTFTLYLEYFSSLIKNMYKDTSEIKKIKQFENHQIKMWGFGVHWKYDCSVSQHIKWRILSFHLFFISVRKCVCVCSPNPLAIPRMGFKVEL